MPLPDGAAGWSSTPTRLVPATSDHLDWAMAGDESTLSDDWLRLAPGGVGSVDMIAWTSRIADDLAAMTGERGVWLIVEDEEVVGLISIKGPPREGVVEIGYGVAEARRQRGHATRAVALVVAATAQLGWNVMAETLPLNRASQRVLARNGFVRSGERLDADNGRLLVWHRPRA